MSELLRCHTSDCMSLVFAKKDQAAPVYSDVTLFSNVFVHYARACVGVVYDAAIIRERAFY